MHDNHSLKQTEAVLTSIMPNAEWKTIHGIGGTEANRWVPGNVIYYLKVLLYVISAIKNMLSATSQLVLFQISDTCHMKNKAFYLLRGKSCFAELIKSKPVDHPETGLNLLFQS